MLLLCGMCIMIIIIIIIDSYKFTYLQILAADFLMCCCVSWSLPVGLTLNLSFSSGVLIAVTPQSAVLSLFYACRE